MSTYADSELLATNVILTGSTGFLGKSVLREFRGRVEAGVLHRVNLFLPIRGDTRKGLSGQDRCETIAREHGFFYSDSESCEKPGLENDSPVQICVRWIDPTLGADAWPAEINLVLLSAFDTAFDRPLGIMLNSSVRPIVEVLRSVADDIHKSQAQKRWPALSQVVLVSTAYVQPPLPFVRRGIDGDRVGAWAPQNLWGKESVNKLYERLVGIDDLTIEFARTLLPNLPGQTTYNSYIFCKTLLEAVVDNDPRFEVFSQKNDLTFTIVRPSIVGASLDGKYYSAKSPGCAALLLATSQLAGRGSAWWGSIDLVPVCRVAKAIVLAAAIDNISESSNEVNWVVADSLVGSSKPKIRYVTNGLSFSTIVLTRACGKLLCTAWPKQLLPIIQQFEIIFVSVLFGSVKAGEQIRSMYHHYSYFTTNTFDFPTVIGLNIPDMIMETKGGEESSMWVQRYFKEQREVQMKKSNMKVYVLVILSLITCYLISNFFFSSNLPGSVFDDHPRNDTMILSQF